MIQITFKYQNVNESDAQEFRDYTKNLTGYNEYCSVRYGTESSLYSECIVCMVSIPEEHSESAFDIVNYYLMDREVNVASTSFNINVPNIGIYVSGCSELTEYIMGRSVSHLYSKISLYETALSNLIMRHMTLEKEMEKVAGFIHNVGVDKFPDIVKTLINSMEAEGYECKKEINQILERKTH